MTIAASSILDRAATILQDSGVRWPVDELVQWFNDGQREVCLFKPEASVANTAMQLTALNTKQSLPTAAIRLIDLVRNMGADGLTPGAPIRMVTREILDVQRPDWHTQTAATAIRHGVFDPRNPKNFYVFPRPATAIYVDAIYAVNPVDVTTVTGVATGNLALDDIFASALLDYVLFRAFLKDSENPANAQRAAAHRQLFDGAVGARNQTDAGIQARPEA
jgi:hypothetical protein